MGEITIPLEITIPRKIVKMEKPKLTKEEKKLGYSYRYHKSGYSYDDFYPAGYTLVDKKGNIVLRTALDSTKGKKGSGAIFIQKEIDRLITGSLSPYLRKKWKRNKNVRKKKVFSL